jgi:type II secretory pathway pseudopilin PulG
LLLVVFIITTITSMALPTLLGTRQRANYARAATDSRTLATLVLEYATQHDTYPGQNFIEVLRKAGYGTVPDTDPWGHPYAAATVVGSGGVPSSSDDEIRLAACPWRSQGIGEIGPVNCVVLPSRNADKTRRASFQSERVAPKQHQELEVWLAPAPRPSS